MPCSMVNYRLLRTRGREVYPDPLKVPQFAIQSILAIGCAAFQTRIDCVYNSRQSSYEMDTNCEFGQGLRDVSCELMARPWSLRTP